MVTNRTTTMGATLRLKGYKVRAGHTITWTAFWVSVTRTFNIINMETEPMNKPNLYASLHSISTGVNVNVYKWCLTSSVIPSVRFDEIYTTNTYLYFASNTWVPSFARCRFIDDSRKTKSLSPFARKMILNLVAKIKFHTLSCIIIWLLMAILLWI